MNDFCANQATEKDDHADTDHLYDTARADDKWNDWHNRPF